MVGPELDIRCGNTVAALTSLPSTTTYIMAITAKPAGGHKKKALLVGINYMNSKTQEVLDLPHRDVTQLRQFLIGKPPDRKFPAVLLLAL